MISSLKALLRNRANKVVLLASTTSSVTTYSLCHNLIANMLVFYLVLCF